MKKNVWKRVTAIVLCFTFLFSLGACKKSDSENKTAATPTTGAGETSSVTEVPQKEDLTLTAFVQQSASTESGIWTGWGAKKLYDDTKLKLEFYPSGDSTEEKLQQYLVAGTLPDLVGFKGQDQAQMAMDANMLVDLTEYKNLLPNIFESKYYKDAVAYTEKYVSKDTGKLLIMPTAIGASTTESLNWVPQLQWSLFKKAGMPAVNTLEDYLDVVDKMVKLKPKTADGEKVYGFSLFSDWDNLTAKEISTLSFFYGIDTEYVSQLMETNIITKETNSLLDENSFYKRALKFYYEANQRGLLDPDSATQTYSNVDAKYSAGRVMFSWFSWMTGTYNSNASGHVTNAEDPDGYAAVIANDMKLYDAPDQTIGRNWYFGISKNCKDIERACELLNWMYDPEVQMYLGNGPEGTIWKNNDKGEPEIIDPAGYDIVLNQKEAMMPDDIGGGTFESGQYAFNTLGLNAATIMDNGFTKSYRYWPSYLNRNPNELKKEQIKWMGENTVAQYALKKNLTAKSTQAVNMIPTLSDDMQMTVTQIGEIVKKFSWQMVYAKDEAEFNSLWDTMVKQAKGLGLDDVTAYYKQAWADALVKVADYE